MKVFFFRFHPAGYPLVGIVVSSRLVLLEYIGPFTAQRLSQVFQQHPQRLVWGFLQQCDTQALVDYGFQILNAPHAAVPLMGLDVRRISLSLLKKLP